MKQLIPLFLIRFFSPQTQNKGPSCPKQYQGISSLGLCKVDSPTGSDTNLSLHRCRGAELLLFRFISLEALLFVLFESKKLWRLITNLVRYCALWWSSLINLYQGDDLFPSMICLSRMIYGEVLCIYIYTLPSKSTQEDNV